MRYHLIHKQHCIFSCNVQIGTSSHILSSKFHSSLDIGFKLFSPSVFRFFTRYFFLDFCFSMFSSISIRKSFQQFQSVGSDLRIFIHKVSCTHNYCYT